MLMRDTLQQVSYPGLLHLPTQIRLPIGGKRVTCHGSTISGFLHLSQKYSVAFVLGSISAALTGLRASPRRGGVARVRFPKQQLVIKPAIVFEIFRIFG